MRVSHKPAPDQAHHDRSVDNDESVSVRHFFAHPGSLTKQQECGGRASAPDPHTHNSLVVFYFC